MDTASASEKPRAPLGAVYAKVKQGSNVGRGYYCVRGDNNSFKYFAWEEDVRPPPLLNTDNEGLLMLVNETNQACDEILNRVKRIKAIIGKFDGTIDSL